MGRGPRVVVCAWALLLLCSQAVPAQNVTEAALKGALIHNFAKYTKWLPDALPPQAPFLACVLGDKNVADALERSVRGRLLSDHPVTVSFVTATTALRSCHLLYISAVAQAQANVALAAVRGAPVLTMVDIENFNRRGTIVRVFVESGKVQFDIDLWLARGSGLGLSSQVLSLASRTYSEPDPFGAIP
jgi:hypothetical protein